MKLLHDREVSYRPQKEAASMLGELVGRTAPLHSAAYSIAATRLGKGGSVQRHYHAVSDEIYLFTEGACTMAVNGATFRVQAGSAVVLEPGDRHEILPCAAPVVFYAVSVPPFVPEDFLTEEESGHETGF